MARLAGIVPKLVAATVTCAACAPYQPPPTGNEVQDIQQSKRLPKEAVRGPYDVLVEPTFGSTDHLVFRPAVLDAFPDEDALPIVVWGNGGCSPWGDAYAAFLSTLASQGFLVVTAARQRAFSAMDMSVGVDRVTKADLIAGLDWAEAEASREGSPL